MLRDFEKLFASYADVPTIARSALGPAARQASSAQLSAFSKAFQGYISRKYGRRFREFVGGRIEVTDARQVKSFVEVVSTAYMQGESPFEVRWHVSDKAGKSLFFNIIIEGGNMLASERTRSAPFWTSVAVILTANRRHEDALTRPGCQPDPTVSSPPSPARPR
jgi:phospholipid transport system substrate-binding protein